MNLDDYKRLAAIIDDVKSNLLNKANLCYSGDHSDSMMVSAVYDEISKLEQFIKEVEVF